MIPLRCSAAHASRLQGVTGRQLIEWCAARLAHFKVPSAVHILAQMPTTGSGKILKTELKKMFGGASTLPTTAAAASTTNAIAVVPAAVGLAEAAAVVAAACGGTGVSCQPLDAGLGTEWGRELLPDLTYLLVVEQAGAIQAQARFENLPGEHRFHLAKPLANSSAGLRGWRFAHAVPQVEEAAGGKGLLNLAVVCLEKPATEHLAGLTSCGARLVVLHVSPSACTAAAALSGSSAAPGELRTALAAARELLPPFGGVLHAPVPAEEAAAATQAVLAAQAVGSELVLSAQLQSTGQEVLAASAAEPAVHAGMTTETVRRSIVSVLGTLLGQEAAEAMNADEPLMSAGVTSTLAVQLTQKLEEALGTELPGTLVFDYPSINEMAAFLIESELAGVVTSTPLAPPPTTSTAPPTTVIPSAHATRVPAAIPAAAPPALLRAAPAVAAAGAAGGPKAGVEALVLRQVAALRGGGSAAEAGGMTADMPLMSSGVTSTLAVQLTQQLEEALGTELPGTLVFDYPTGERGALAPCD